MVFCGEKKIIRTLRNKKKKYQPGKPIRGVANPKIQEGGDNDLESLPLLGWNKTKIETPLNYWAP